jgi:hypothetical protein
MNKFIFDGENQPTIFGCFFTFVFDFLHGLSFFPAFFLLILFHSVPFDSSGNSAHLYLLFVMLGLFFLFVDTAWHRLKSELITKY